MKGYQDAEYAERDDMNHNCNSEGFCLYCEIVKIYEKEKSMSDQVYLLAIENIGLKRKVEELKKELDEHRNC